MTSLLGDLESIQQKLNEAKSVLALKQDNLTQLEIPLHGTTFLHANLSLVELQSKSKHFILRFGEAFE